MLATLLSTSKQHSPSAPKPMGTEHSHGVCFDSQQKWGALRCSPRCLLVHRTQHTCICSLDSWAHSAFLPLCMPGSHAATASPLLTCACHCSRCWGRGLGHQLPATPLGQRNWPLRRFLQSGATGKVVKLVREREFTGELQKYTTDLRIQLLPAHSSKPSGSPSQGPDQQGPAAGGCEVYAVCTTVYEPSPAILGLLEDPGVCLVVVSAGGVMWVPPWMPSTASASSSRS